MAEFKMAFETGNEFASGTAVKYGKSIIVASDENGAKQDSVLEQKEDDSKMTGRSGLATNISIGTRFKSFKVLNQADARPWHFQEILKSDGRWRIVVFAGDVSQPEQKARIQQLGSALSSPNSFVSRFTPPGQKIDSVIEILTIHSAPRADTELTDFPEIFRPYSEEAGTDYWKIYVDDLSYHEGHGEAYKNYGVDKMRGCMVIVRPDQYISWIGELEEVGEMNEFFSGFMIPQRK